MSIDTLEYVVAVLATRADIEQTEQRLEQKIERMVKRVEATIWKAAIATMVGVLAIGSLLMQCLR